jgi:hypothetical protein
MKHKPLRPAWSRNGMMPANDISEHPGSEPYPDAHSLTSGRTGAFSRAHKSEQSSKHSGGDNKGEFKDLYGMRSAPPAQPRSWRWR